MKRAQRCPLLTEKSIFKKLTYHFNHKHLKKITKLILIPEFGAKFRLFLF
jgi:hypothetical protein